MQRSREEFEARVAHVSRTCSVDGWDAYDAKPLRAGIVDAMREAVGRLVDAGLGWPYVFPRNDGGVMVEFCDAHGWNVTVEFGDGCVEGDATRCTDPVTSVDFALDGPLANDIDAVVGMTMAMVARTGWVPEQARLFTGREVLAEWSKISHLFTSDGLWDTRVGHGWLLA